MEQNIEVKIEGGGDYKIIETRTGSALPLKEPVIIGVLGIISAPADFLEKRIDQIKPKETMLIVDRENFNINLIIDEKNHYRTTINGKLTLSKEFKLFSINTGEERSTFDLADLIKMNRSYFESKEEAMKLVKELREFKAKIDKEVELSKDDRANYSIKKTQAVESNIPKSFKLALPIFKGMKPTIIEVEISINPNDLDCQLISPEANDLVVDISNSLIQTEIERIKQIGPEIAILEI